MSMTLVMYMHEHVFTNQQLKLILLQKQKIHWCLNYVIFAKLFLMFLEYVILNSKEVTD